MHYRTLGRTKLKVSEVSLGCNRLGESIATEPHWDTLVGRAVDLGVNFFDTAENYSATRSEEVLGRIAGNRDDLYIETKMSMKTDRRPEGFGTAQMIAAVEASLKRLQRERIDVYMLHSPSREVLEQDDWREAMERCGRDGKVRFAGVAANNVEDSLYVMRNNLAEVLQITYNILTFDAEGALFETAEETETGLVCRMSLARGVLAGKFAPGEPVPDGHRAALSNTRNLPRLQKTEQLRSLAAGYEGGLVRMAHHFCLSVPEISCIIPGARNIEQLEENTAASNGTGLPSDNMEKIRRLQREWGGSEDHWF